MRPVATVIFAEFASVSIHRDKLYTVRYVTIYHYRSTVLTRWDTGPTTAANVTDIIQHRCSKCSIGG